MENRKSLFEIVIPIDKVCVIALSCLVLSVCTSTVLVEDFKIASSYDMSHPASVVVEQYNSL